MSRTNGLTLPIPAPVARAAAPAAAASRAGSIITLDQVTKVYGANGTRVHALAGVSLSVERGEMVAIMGQSGCGKTTLLNCASGLDDVTSGSVSIAGQDIATLSDKARTTFRAHNMGFVFQTYNLLPVLSAVENVELPLVVSGVSPKEARQRAQAALERVGLRAQGEKRPAQLSGGQRQRVTIARSLVNNPEIVWADEPTGALDSRTADDIITLMETLNEDQGLTFVIVTHDASVGARCHRIIHMVDGAIVREERLR